MARTDSRVVVERENSLTDIFKHLIAVRAPKIRATHAALKQGISGKDGLRHSQNGVFVQANANASGTMARSMKKAQFKLSDPELFAILNVMVDRQRVLIVIDPKEGSLHLESLVELFVPPMEADFGARMNLPDFPSGTNVVQMSVCLKQVLDLELQSPRQGEAGQFLKNSRSIVPRIHQ